MPPLLSKPVLLQTLDLTRAPVRGASSGGSQAPLVVTGLAVVAVLGYVGFRFAKNRWGLGNDGGQGDDLSRSEREKIRQARDRGNHLKAGKLLKRADADLEAANAFVEAEAYQAAGEAYARAGQDAQAVHYLKKAGRRQRAAKIYAESGKNLAAAAEFSKLDKPSLAAKYYERAGEHEQAAMHYASAEEHLDAAKNYDDAGEALGAAREYARAYMELGGDGDEGAEGTKDYAERAAELFEEAGRPEKAAKLYRRAGDTEKTAVMLRESGRVKEAADLLMDSGKVQGAVSLLEEAGESEEAYRARAREAYDSGEYDRAAVAFKQAGEFEKAAKLYHEALDESEKAAELYEEADAWNEAASVYRELGEYADAAHCAERGGALGEAAELYRQAGDVEGEIRVRKSQGDYFRAAQLLYDQRRYQESLQVLQNINSRDPIYQSAQELQGDAFRSLDKRERAYGRYRAALGNRDPSESTLPIHYKMARVLEKEEDFEDALEHYEAIVEVDPGFEDSKKRKETIEEALSAQAREELAGLQSSQDDKRDELDVSGRQGEMTTSQEAVDGSEVRYEFLEEIARGGMGIVYKAKDTFLNRIVAVKTLGEDLQDNETAVKYFLREARAAAALHHPNIVTIYDAGEQQGDYYIAMEYVDGRTLKEEIKDGKIFTEKEVRNMMIQASRALEYAHENEVVHRDIKSGNIMRKDDETMKVMDFGLAKFLREFQAEHTQQVGTPYYMSPEQIIGENIDFRSDLYGLGCTAFECVTGRVPFTEGELAYHHVHTEPPSPSEFNDEISRELERIILRLMEKDADDRYESAAALRERLED